MKNIFYILYFFTLFNSKLIAQASAFPSAYGGGSDVSGGRGYNVFLVTNLNASGVGSLDQALINAKAAGGGNIIFRVSGTINYNLSDGVTKNYNSLQNITIAGQSAPQGGITITSPLFLESCNNLIIRYIRFRTNFSTGKDCLSIRTSQNVIIDHCSFSGGADEGVGFSGTYGAYNPSNYTLQNSIIADSKTGALIGDSEHPSLSTNISVNNNLWYNVSHRTPNINAANGETINNVVFNWKNRLKSPTGDSEGIYINLNDIGNYYKTGLLSTSDLTSGRGVLNKIYNYSGNPQPVAPLIYVSGNYIDKGTFTQQQFWQNWNGGFANSSFFVSSQFSLIKKPFPIQTAHNAYNDVLNNSGANKVLDANGNVINNRDNMDTLFVHNILNNIAVNYQPSGVYDPNVYRNQSHHINFQASISSTPINTHPSGYDSNSDGIPDTWASTHMGANSYNDTIAAGYTWLEVYLNGVDSCIGTNCQTCPNYLVNEDALINLPNGTLSAGADYIIGNSILTNGSSCAVEISNYNTNQPWARLHIPVTLSNYGISSGDIIEIGLDGNNYNGVARIEVVQDNTPNTAVSFHNYSGASWESFRDTIMVPYGITSLDLWIYSNYNNNNSGTTLYDNLLFKKLNTTSVQTNLSKELIVYPNPVNDILTIKGLEKGEYYKVYSSEGRVIKYSNEATLNVSNLSKGLYIIELKNKQIKIIKN